MHAPAPRAARGPGQCRAKTARFEFWGSDLRTGEQCREAAAGARHRAQAIERCVGHEATCGARAVGSDGGQCPRDHRGEDWVARACTYGGCSLGSYGGSLGPDGCSLGSYGCSLGSYGCSLGSYGCSLDGETEHVAPPHAIPVLGAMCGAAARKARRRWRVPAAQQGGHGWLAAWRAAAAS